MYFTHDANMDFFYYGENQPHSRTYKELVESDPKLIAVDVETISLKERVAIGIGIAFTPDDSLYFVMFPEESPIVPLQLLQDPSVTKVFHNAMFDLAALREYEVDTTNVRDTNVMAHLLGYADSKLSSLAGIVGKEAHSAKELLDKGKIMLDLPKETVARKCCQDCMATLALYHEFNKHIDQQYFDTEMQLIPILLDMSYRGILIDQKVRGDVETALRREVEYQEELCDGEGFNPSSPQQVAYTLAKRGAYSVFPRIPFTNGGRSIRTDKDTLSKMIDPLAGLVLNHRDKAYLLSHYIKPWGDDDRAYCRYHLDAITGRPSSTERNMQNIPGRFRKDGSENVYNCRGILLPDSGIWTDADWEQLEPRVLAHLSDDKEMQYIFSLPKYNPDGSRNEEADIHLQVAMFMNIARKLGKTINLAMTYGATDETLMEQSGIKSLPRVRQLREMWGRKFPQAMDWIESRQEDALRTGIAKTLFGRKIRLPSPEEESLDGIRRKAVDYPCQGSAAEIHKRGLILCKGMPMSLIVHDEILFDGKVELPEGLDSIAPFRTPIAVKYLQRWE